MSQRHRPAAAATPAASPRRAKRVAGSGGRPPRGASDYDSPKRAAILDAALELFAERGFHGTAVPLVADRARVGAGTLYRYFTSKEALVNALYQRWKGALAEYVLTGFPVQAPARQQFHEFWSRMAAFAVEHPAGFTFLELHHHSPYLDDDSRAIEQRVLMMVKSFVDVAQAQQVLKPIRADVMIALTWGAFVGLHKAAAMGYLTIDDEIVRQSEELIWEAIRI
jgi:AcrR family transcriptional regulator